MSDTDPAKPTDTANSAEIPTGGPRERERIRTLLKSIQDTLARGAEILQRSKRTISRIPDKW